jgi:hypothetical protein
VRASPSPNETLNIALVGVGGREAANLAGVGGENIVALCDVDERRASASFDSWDHGRKQPSFWQQHHLPDWAWGVFVGSKGMLLVNYSQRSL